jgi:hypothetical protein
MPAFPAEFMHIVPTEKHIGDAIFFRGISMFFKEQKLP